MEQSNLLEGSILLIDKPLRWTSFDVVKKTRNLLRTHFQVKNKGRPCRNTGPSGKWFIGCLYGKIYQTHQRISGTRERIYRYLYAGQYYPSYDLETEINQTFSTLHITEEKIQKTSQQFIGIIEQFPPAYSALKKDGERLYEKARRGEQIKVDVYKYIFTALKLQELAPPEVDFRVVCSKGTYIRSLAHDFGKALNSGAHLSALCRRRIEF